jgi:hypothetical protein
MAENEKTMPCTTPESWSQYPQKAREIAAISVLLQNHHDPTRVMTIGAMKRL